MDTATRHRELAIRWFEEVWNQRRGEVIDELSHPACVGHLEGKDTCHIDDFKVFREQLLGAIPDLKVEIEDVVADEQAAVVRWRAAGTHSGDAMGLKATQAAVTFSGISWLQFKDGKLIEGWDRWNRDGLLRQLKAF